VTGLIVNVGLHCLYLWYTCVPEATLVQVSLDLQAGREPRFGETLRDLPLSVKYFGAKMLLTLLVLGGLALAVIPGIYFILRYQLVLYFVVARRCGPLTAFRLSSQATRGARGRLLAFDAAKTPARILDESLPGGLRQQDVRGPSARLLVVDVRLPAAALLGGLEAELAERRAAVSEQALEEIADRGRGIVGRGDALLALPRRLPGGGPRHVFPAPVEQRPAVGPFQSITERHDAGKAGFVLAHRFDQSLEPLKLDVLGCVGHDSLLVSFGFWKSGGTYLRLPALLACEP
jgi:hypothetical protein